MELKEYLKIFKEHIQAFIVTVVVIVAGSFIYFGLKPVSYDTSLLLNITRSGSQTSAEYKFDDFYRLQADEKFAETVVQWLANPRVATDILAEAGIDSKNFSLRQLSKSIKAEKLSSQVVAVNFSAPTAGQAGKMADAIVSVISKNTEFLNKDQEENNWFKIDAQPPVIIKSAVSAQIIFLASLALGIFIGFWLVLIIHYLE